MATTDTAEPSTPPRQPRRWFRFSLRSLFVLMTLIAVLVVSYASIKRWATMGVISPALIRVQYRAPDLLADEAAATARDGEFEAYRNTQVALIKSPFVLQATLRKPKIAGIPLVKQHKADAVRWMQEFLQVEVVGDSEIIQISFNDGSAMERAAITNAIKESYMDEIVNGERMEKLRQRDVLERLYKKGREEWRQRAEKIRALDREFGSDENEIKKRLLVRQLDGLADRRSRIQDRVHELELQQDVATKNASGAVDNSNTEREACERQLANLDKLISEQVKAIKAIGRESIQVETLRVELDLLADDLKQLGSRLKSRSITLDSMPRVQSIEDAVAK